MKSFFSRLSGIMIAIIVLMLIVVFLGWSRIPDMIAGTLSKKTKVPVDIEDVILSFSSIEIEKFEMGNPPGSTLQKSFFAGSTKIKAPLRRYLDERIVIEEVILKDVYLGLEFPSPTNHKGNWQTIMNNLSASSSGDQKSNKSFLIKRIILSDINVDLLYQSEGKIRHLPPINHLEFTNITSEEGIPSAQLANIILKETLKSILQKENLQHLLEDILQSPLKSPTDFLKPLEGLFGQ